MTIVRWSPFPEIEAFDRRMRRMLDEFGIAPAAIPAADVYETAKEFTFELEVPGFEEKELSVQVSNHTLVVKGEQLETKDEKDKQDKQYRLHERLEMTFERRFTLPLDVDTTSIGAEFTKGVLIVHAPKVDVPKPRKVAIAAKT
jgi:HSP20 family protein